MRHVNITINFDFVSGKELSYIEGLESNVDFETNCLEFFCFDYPNAKAVKKNGSYISVNKLLENSGEHTNKQLRKAHNLRRMLVAGALKFLPNNEHSCAVKQTG